MYFLTLSAALVFLLDFIVLYSYEFCIIFSFCVATTITNKQRDLIIKSFQEVLAKLHENSCAKDCTSACGGSFDKVDTLTRLQKLRVLLVPVTSFDRRALRRGRLFLRAFLTLRRPWLHPFRPVAQRLTPSPSTREMWVLRSSASSAAGPTTGGPRAHN
jgi:hypothetical protein